MYRTSRFTIAGLVAILISGGAVAAACSTSEQAEPGGKTFEPLELNQAADKWSDAFQVASAAGPDAVVAASREYLATISPMEADQIADELDAQVYTHAGMREALVNTLSETGHFDEALSESLRLAGEIPASRLALMQSHAVARVDLRHSVVGSDDAKRDVLLAQLIANEPEQQDAESVSYSYTLAAGLFIAGRTDEAIPRFLEILGSDEQMANSPLSIDEQGSAMNMAVTALRAEGRLEEANALIERLIRFDDANHRNFSGRNGENTNPGDQH